MRMQHGVAIPETIDEIKVFLKGNDFPLEDLFNCRMIIPEYTPMRVGTWDLRLVEDRPSRGYFNGMRMMNRDVPLLTKEQIPWMSVVPMECESHMPHTCRDGDMLVYGLGLGYVVYNMCYHSASSVTVVEQDPEVIDLFHRATAGITDWERIRDMITIVQGDAFEYQPTRYFDHVYIDIWPSMFDSRAMTDTVRICKRLQARVKTVSWWTMEADLLSWGMQSGVMVDELNGSSWFAMGEDRGLDVEFWDGFDYDQYVQYGIAAMRNQIIG